MKKIIFLIFTLAVVQLSYAQNKKEQIEILNNRVDSLKIAFQNENSIKKIEIEKLESTSKDLEVQKNNLQLKIADLNASISEFKLSNYLLKDSLTVCLKNIIELDSTYQNSLQKIIELNAQLESKIDSVKLPLSEKIGTKEKDSVEYTVLYFKHKSCPECVSSGYIEIDTSDIAQPFAIYSKGKFIDPPTCNKKLSNNVEEKKGCNFSEKELVPLVLPSKKLFSIVDGNQNQVVNCLKYVEVGFEDYWTRPSAIINKNLKCDILTNNPFIGLKPYKIPQAPLKIKKRYFEGQELETNLISKIDIDLDGYAEMIYKCDALEGYYYEIYSFKNQKWTKVYEGGHQGFSK
jgi:hypothetical protein